MSNAGQAASGIIGGVIGFFIGGPIGAVYGFQIGILAGSALFPTQLPGVQGPRLSDFETIQADPGATIPVGFGTFAVPGYRMYLGEAEEESTTEEIGGKGAPEQQQTTFTYRQTIALGLCEGPINGVSRVWENGKLVYDRRPQFDGEADADFDARVEMSQAYEETFTLYLGSEDQLADPTIEQEKGAGNVPAFRGLAYMVYPKRLLASDQGNRHPVFKVEVGQEFAVVVPAERVVVYVDDIDNPDIVNDPIEGPYWLVPDGVTEIEVLLVGGGGGAVGGIARGGGGAGEVKYFESIAVTPGEHVRVDVGAGAVGSLSTDYQDGSSTILTCDAGVFTAHGGQSSGFVLPDNPPSGGDAIPIDTLASSGGGFGYGRGSDVVTETLPSVANPTNGNDGGRGLGFVTSIIVGGFPHTYYDGAGGGGGGAGGDGAAAVNIVDSGKAGGDGGVGLYFGDKFGTDIGDAGWFGGGGGGSGGGWDGAGVGLARGTGLGGQGGGLPRTTDPITEDVDSNYMRGTGGGGMGKMSMASPPIDYNDRMLALMTGRSGIIVINYRASAG